MSAIYNDFESGSGNIKGGFAITTNNENKNENEITGGGGKIQFRNKVIPFGLAMKRIKPQLNYECKNGDVLDNTLFEKLFNSIAKVNSSIQKEKKNTTRKSKK